jgi:hypothetical protein
MSTSTQGLLLALVAIAALVWIPLLIRNYQFRLRMHNVTEPKWVPGQPAVTVVDPDDCEHTVRGYYMTKKTRQRVLCQSCGEPAIPDMEGWQCIHDCGSKIVLEILEPLPKEDAQ